jgi:carbohydrate kinase (thermoresistant glucokinase family)
MGAANIVVMGVSGCGKSTLGAELAQRLGMRYVEGDDLHPPGNVERMAAGIAPTARAGSRRSSMCCVKRANGRSR